MSRLTTSSDSNDESNAVDKLMPNKTGFTTKPLKDIHFINEYQVCSNCGVQLAGEYCHQCGQTSRSMIKFFGEVVKELLDDLVGYDSRLKHTLLPLFFSPGKLSLEYVKGRRFYYVQPFRLYLFSSLIFILALQLNTDPEKITLSGTEQQQSVQPQSPSAKVQAQSALPASTDSIDNPNNPDKTQSSSSEKRADNVGLFIDESGWRYQGVEIEEAGLMKDIADEINSKADGWLKNPKPLIDELFQLLPYMMFVLLPLFALLLKLMYFFSHRYYVEHLVFALHNHCFLYVTLMIEMSIQGFIQLIDDPTGWLEESMLTTLEWLSNMLPLWIVIYLVVALKRYYQQGWPMTLSKTLLLSLMYFLLLTFGLVVTVLTGAYRA